MSALARRPPRRQAGAGRQKADGMTAGKGIVVGLVLLWLALGVDAAVLVWMSQGGSSGPDQVLAVLGRVLLASILAMTAWILGRQQPAGSWPKRLSLVPVAVTGVLGLAVLAMNLTAG